jgi:hypothetical protein
LTRTEAEYLVDVIEESGAMLYLADELRQMFGMTPRAEIPAQPTEKSEIPAR